MSQILFPDSPFPGDSIVAPNGVLYTYDEPFGPGVEGVWLATPSGPLAVTAGSISGNPAVGQVLTYTDGVASGGTPPYNYAHEWFVDGVGTGITLPNYTVTAGDQGKAITVTITVTDFAGGTASATTAPVNIPANLTITNPGTITGTPQVGATLNYAGYAAAGGFGTVNFTWVWKITPNTTIPLSANQQNIIVPANAVGQKIYIDLLATDSNTPADTATAVTANFPSSGTITRTPFPTSVWDPQPANGLDTIPGLVSGLYKGTSTTITPSGCIEIAKAAGGPWISAPSTLTIAPNTDTLYARWSVSSICGGAASDTDITGSITDGTFENVYNIRVQRKPTAFSFTPVTGAPLNTVEQSTTATITNINTTAYVTYGPGTTPGITSTLEARIGGAGGTWTPIPAAGAFGTGLTIQNLQTLEVRFNTGSSASAVNIAEIYVGDGDASKFTAAPFQVTNTSNPVFPGLTFSPTPEPTASPDYTNLSSPSLYGTVTATWPNLPSNPISVTSTGSLEFRNVTAGGSFGQGVQTLNTGNIIEIRWKLADADAALDLGTLTGNLTGGGYTNVFTLPVAKLPGAYTWGNKSNEGTGATVVSNAITISDINCPAQLSYTPDPTNPLTNVEASIGGLGFVPIPVAPAAGLPVYPSTLAGNVPTQIIIRGDTGPNPGVTYSITTFIGDGSSSVSDVWNVETALAPSAITTPNITAPTGTNNDPGVFSPAGLTVTGSNYSIASGSPGAHTTSDWQVVSSLTNGTRNPLSSAITGVGVTSPLQIWTNNFGPTTVFGIGASPSSVIITGEQPANTNVIYTSFDGTSFTQTYSGAGGGTNRHYATGYGGGKLLAVSSGSTLVSTDNGASWTAYSPPPTTFGPYNYTGGLAYGNGVWVLSGSGASNNDPAKLWTSGDGINWTARTWGVSSWDSPPLNSAPRASISFANNKFYASGSGSGSPGILSSIDGQTWTPVTGTPSIVWSSVLYNGSTFFTLGFSPPFYAATPYTSGDGSSWSAATTPAAWSAGQYGSIFVSGNTFYVLPTGGGATNIYYTTDGNSWNSLTSNINNGVGVNNVYNNRVYTSSSSGFQYSIVGALPVLNFANNNELAGMQIGDTIVEVGGGNDATGTIFDKGTTSLVVSPSTGTWDIGSFVKDTSRTISVPAAPLISTNTISNVAGGNVLSIAGANTDGFLVGNTVSNGVTGAGAAFGTITAIDSTTVTVNPASANWLNGQNLYMGKTVVNVLGQGAPLQSYFIAQSLLTTSTTYEARVRYHSATTDSAWSSWASFGTSATFTPPAPGTAYGGGYFAGQIKVPAGAGGTIYNLVVAPIRGSTSGPDALGPLLGQYSTNGGTSPATIAYSTSTGMSLNPTQANDLAYGKPWTDIAGGTTTTGQGGIYPLFGWCKNDPNGPNGNGGIGGFTDWYIPAQNELEVIYYYLKPTGALNSINWGSNANAVPPEPVSTNYTTNSPGITSASLFQNNAPQAFAPASGVWWSSSQVSVDTTRGWAQIFDIGAQYDTVKTDLRYARAVRRVQA